MNNNEKLDPISKWAQDINEVLSSYRKLASSVTDHAGMIGESREFFIREILRRFLPSSVNVGTGQLVGLNEKLSKQVDIVISRPDFPILTSLARSNVYFSESVIATLEIKSSLTGTKKGTLWEALDNCRSVKQSEFDYSTKGAEKPFNDLRWLTPSSYIFGYKGYKQNLTALRNSISSWIKARNPSFLELPDIIVTEGCVIAKNDYRFFDSNKLKKKLGFDCIFLAMRDSNGLNWLLYHLLNQITFTLGEPIHKRTGIRYLIRKDHLKRQYFEEQSQKWGEWDFDNADNHISGIIEF